MYVQLPRVTGRRHALPTLISQVQGLLLLEYIYFEVFTFWYMILCRVAIQRKKLIIWLINNFRFKYHRSSSVTGVKLRWESLPWIDCEPF